jgi:phage tail sheath protein FI
MPTYLHPGVYVEEISGGARPIEAVGTSTAAFVGIAEKGPIGEPKFVTNFTEYQQTFGGYVRENGTIGTSYLAYSVYQFFQNGGASCYVVRVENGAATASLDLYAADGSTKTMTVTAISPGLWGNDLRIAIGPGVTDVNGFNLYVFKKDELVESYEDLSMVNDSPFYVDKVTKRSLYIQTESVDLPDNPSFTGKKDLSAGVKMTTVKNIKLQIDNFGPYVIDCSAGAANTSAVTAGEICNNINAQFQSDIPVPVASVEANKIKITSPTATPDSKIVFTAPAGKDATYDIFGLQESSWVVKGSDETIALAYGLAVASGIHTALAGGTTFSIGLDTASPSDVALTQGLDAGKTLFGAIDAINAVISGVAYTDGAHVILKAAQDIKIKQTNADKLLGSAFYSCAFYGSAGDPAKIQSSGAVATITGDVKIKIDNSPSIIVSVAAGDSADAVAAKINAAFQKASKKKQKIAEVSGTAIVLSSIATGATGRIIISSHTGTDAAASVFGTAHKNSADYLIAAETQSVSRLTGTADLSTVAGVGASLAGKKFRISVDDNTLQYTITALATDKTPALFTKDFADKSAFNYHMLTAGKTLEMIAASTMEIPELYFSIPLTGAEDTAADPTADAQNVYKSMFGNISPFDGSLITSPQYTYEFDTPDNNPQKTFTGDEIVMENNLSLSGGAQDRSSEANLKNLTTGTDGKSGLRALDNLTDISLLVIPGWSKMSEATAITFINEGTSYCDKVRPNQARPLRDLFFITNTPDPANSTVTDSPSAKNFVMNNVDKSAGGYAAIYYPWVNSNDPIGTSSPTISLPPAGMVAGLYASIDGRRGVWKAPAGTEAGLAGVVSLSDQVNDIKQDQLNPYGVNAIRKMPGAGIVAWGSRTLYTNPEWKYIPVRRTAMMMEVSIYEGIQWAVFEPNDTPLWSLLRLNINAFMMNMFRNGAFQGTKPEDAFFVKCDSETTTQVDIDLGKVNILVGFAPLKPAEFVIVKLSQKSGQTA